MEFSDQAAGGHEALRPPQFAHLEDSVAPAEHILPNQLKDRIRKLGKNVTRPFGYGLLLRRASLLGEYALATPELDGDDALFDSAREDLEHILNGNLPLRHQIRFGANVLLAYEEAFRLRAKGEAVTDTVKQNLRAKLVDIMLDFLDGPDLSSKEYGQLSELIAISYLLNSDLFPYFASWREEANMFPADNHDIYTLHPCARNRLKKVPISIKYREIPNPNARVVTLTVGRLALAVGSSIPPYSEHKEFRQQGREAHATRLAADIIICDMNDEPTSVEDKAFLWSLTAQLQAPLIKFAELPTTPDYASNAEMLKREIVRRKQRARV